MSTFDRGDDPSFALLRTPTAGFAHRDDAHRRPLLDAVAAGVRAVEVDLWLREGQLLVGHDAHELRAGRTLTSLYLEPAAALARTAGAGSAPAAALLLVVDVKTAAVATWRVLAEALEPFADVLTCWEDGGVHPRAVTVVVSGERATRVMAASRRRLAAYDGRPIDLDASGRCPVPPVGLVPMVSADWSLVVGWDSSPPVPPAVRRKVLTMVTAAHARGRAMRFWGTPDTEGTRRDAVWSLLRECGVDHLNSDDLPGLARFLATAPAPPGR